MKNFCVTISSFFQEGTPTDSIIITADSWQEAANEITLEFFDYILLIEELESNHLF